MDTLASNDKLDVVQKQQLMEQLQAQLALASLQDVLQRASDKCFKKCIPKPGSSLDNSEQKCIAMCMDRYMDTLELVTKTYALRLRNRE